ncbi:hypothetical protein TSO5_15940 [Azospirillum sp. TSO5]|nr:hypothetical protein TSO5_15940 [Azospirillum sp. TSO5]
MLHRQDAKLLGIRSEAAKLLLDAEERADLCHPSDRPAAVRESVRAVLNSVRRMMAPYLPH